MRKPAGPVTTSTAQPSQPPKLSSSPTSQRRFSTGVGGAGNITSARHMSTAKRAEDADDDDDHKAYHDHSAPGIVLVKGGHSIGIGTSLITSKLLRQNRRSAPEDKTRPADLLSLQAALQTATFPPPLRTRKRPTTTNISAGRVWQISLLRAAGNPVRPAHSFRSKAHQDVVVLLA
jgi:hypothetical protein